MAAIRIKWSSLLRITELEFSPQPPTVLSLSDELTQSLSWLTAATKHDRKLLRCDENGALLVGEAWSLLNSVEVDELHPDDGNPDTYTNVLAHKGILVATSTQIVKLGFLPVSGGVTENIYVSPARLFWYPYPVYTIIATVVPASGGTASYVGITAFN